MLNSDHAVKPADLTASPQVRLLPGVERQLAVSPLDIRQAKFSTGMRGFDRSEVATFLVEAADSYDQALRETDRLRQEIARLEGQLQQYRELEGGLRSMLLSAQKVADDMRENAQREAARIIREAEGRAELMANAAQAQAEDVQRDIDGLKLKRRDAENGLEATIASLRSALEFIRGQDTRDTRLITHRPRLESIA
jgi:cell division initiation protein